MQIAQRVERRHRNMHEVSNAAYIYQNLVGAFVSERAAKLRNHLDRHLARDYGGALAGGQRRGATDSLSLKLEAFLVRASPVITEGVSADVVQDREARRQSLVRKYQIFNFRFEYENFEKVNVSRI